MSFASKASNMLLARCRARYGKRLTAQDIEALVSCRTVADCASCLRATRYADSLSELNESNLRRRTLERALNDSLLDELYSLSRCEQSVGDWFSDYIIMRAEIKQIISFVQLLAAGRESELILKVPEFILQRSGVDAVRLAQCRSYDDLLEVMKHSRFVRELKALRPLPGNRPDCALIEHALYARFYDEVQEMINRRAGNAREELTDIIGTQIDILNFTYIYRLKKYYGADPAAVRSMMFRGGQRIKPHTMLAMVNAPDADSALDIFIRRTPYGKQFDREELTEGGVLETAMRMITNKRARKLMRTSVNPATVLLAYVLMAETEVHDLTVIVEGVFYGLPREEILDLIIIDELADQAG